MIQRIQSLWLLISIGLSIVLLTLPLGVATVHAETFKLYAFAGLGASGLQIFTILCWFIGFFGLFAVIGTGLAFFSYKNRKKQMKQIRFILVFQFLQSLLYVVLSLVMKSNGQFVLGIPVVLIAVSILLNILALIGIRKDEELVRSTDRIR
jgi:hypothetical protein